MPSKIENIGNELVDRWNQTEGTRKERREIENKIETLLYNELQIVVTNGRLDPEKIKEITLLKDLVQMFK